MCCLTSWTFPLKSGPRALQALQLFLNPKMALRFFHLPSPSAKHFSQVKHLEQSRLVKVAVNGFFSPLVGAPALEFSTTGAGLSGIQIPQVSFEGRNKTKEKMG